MGDEQDRALLVDGGGRRFAQTPLSLDDAVKTALESILRSRRRRRKTDAAGSRDPAGPGRARGRKVSWMESFQTSNNPVFAFGSLLNQRRFAESNFAIDSLNSPGFVNNFQTW